MDNEIISYLEMCRRENASLQRGMNFGIGRNYSVILMSLRENAPYDDRLEDDGDTIIYEGHDHPRTPEHVEPKALDQPEFGPTGKRTQNGLFNQAAQDFRNGHRSAERVRVYEKIRQGIWAYNGVFHLVDSWREVSGNRNVFKFRLMLAEEDDNAFAPSANHNEKRRLIPSAVKVEVWRRDGGRCVVCGATNELHFDHIVPHSKGGTSLLPENVQLLCARHNLAKKDHIE